MYLHIMYWALSKIEVLRDVRNSKSENMTSSGEMVSYGVYILVEVSIWISTLEQMQVPKWDRNRCPEELASSVG